MRLTRKRFVREIRKQYFMAALILKQCFVYEKRFPFQGLEVDYSVESHGRDYENFVNVAK